MSDPSTADAPPPGPDYPSLGLIRRELDRKIADQQARAASFDTKAGLLLGLGGILIGLSLGHLAMLPLLGRGAAGLGAAAAVWAMVPRVSGGIQPRQLRDTYLMQPEAETELTLIDTHILLYELDEQRLASKVFRMRWAVALLIGALALFLAGSIVDYVGN